MTGNERGEIICLNTGKDTNTIDHEEAVKCLNFEFEKTLLSSYTSWDISTCSKISCYGFVSCVQLWTLCMLSKLNFRLQLCMNEMFFHLIANEKERKGWSNRVEIYGIISLASWSKWSSSNLASFFIYELILKCLADSLLLNHRHHASSFSFVCFH